MSNEANEMRKKILDKKVQANLAKSEAIVASAPKPTPRWRQIKRKEELNARVNGKKSQDYSALTAAVLGLPPNATGFVSLTSFELLDAQVARANNKKK